MGAEKLEQALPFWPAAMPRAMALAYTGVAETQLKDWERRGLVRFRPRGPRGQMIAPRVDLDAALASLFDGEADDAGAIEFD
ncbi:hypothetical protein J2Y54_000533 [Sphingomonas sp. BE123]|uniref:hypothetical protein n=1 Tax=Sphingomonas sp. BE123 TaxID=2817842 RepID=UPI002865490C|nr:hypothetical protein [Sphingomonas sp. BE123]MDR6851040.1 hypothetical protein [Sphingomonas sp. BE123]